MECRKEINKQNCNCTYDCPRKGICCECIAHHREKGELPACYFKNIDEKTYDRSIDNYIRLYKK